MWSCRGRAFVERTSTFEGAYRAWSHLGGLGPGDVESLQASDLDPLVYPIVDDTRLTGRNKRGSHNADGSARRIYPYEPLPREGLSHPYVQAILAGWLGPDAETEAIHLGLATLRTWWQHRRKGESGSAIAALGTEKMQAIVDDYTRYFFSYAYRIVIMENAKPPKSLDTKLSGSSKRQQHITNPRYIPGKVDCRGVVEVAASGPSEADAASGPSEVMCSFGMMNARQQQRQPEYGDPDTAPLVFASSNGDIQILLIFQGQRGVYCVRMVESVLVGCNGNKSPIIDGLLDAAADIDNYISYVLIKIDKASNAKRIAFEAARNLSLVGYIAEAVSMSVVDEGSNGCTNRNNVLFVAFRAVASTKPQIIFDWTAPCTCFDKVLFRGGRDCKRHSQMKAAILEAFSERVRQVKQYMVGSGMDCTSDPRCPIRIPISNDLQMDVVSYTAPTMSSQGRDTKQCGQVQPPEQQTCQSRNLNLFSIENSDLGESLGMSGHSGSRGSGHGWEAMSYGSLGSMDDLDGNILV